MPLLTNHPVQKPLKALTKSMQGFLGILIFNLGAAKS